MSRPTDEQLRKWGESLREIDPSSLQEHPGEGRIRWFMGEPGTDVTFWVDDAGLPTHAQVVFARVSLDWTPTRLHTGQFESRAATAGGRYDPYLLKHAAELDLEVGRAALLLLEASSIDRGLVEPLVQAIRAALAQVAPTP